MAKGTLADRNRAVLLYIKDGRRNPNDIASSLGISLSTFWRWIRAYRVDGPYALEPKKPGPPYGTNTIAAKLEEKIAAPKQKHPSWEQGGSSINMISNATG
jgi:transposase-like protein